MILPTHCKPWAPALTQRKPGRWGLVWDSIFLLPKDQALPKGEACGLPGEEGTGTLKLQADFICSLLP